MIWNSQPMLEAENNVMMSYISTEIDSACSEQAGAISKESQLELASAIAAFIRNEHHVSAIESEHLFLLVARALWSIGEEETASRLIALKGAELKFLPLYADVAAASDMSLYLWRLMLNSHAVRPSPLSGAAYGNILVLDLLRALNRASDRLEITVFRVVYALLDEIAALWDRSNGRGVLGLQHVNSMASSLLQCPRKSRKTAALRTEIIKQCVDKLQSLGRCRGWDHVPDVMSLDL